MRLHQNHPIPNIGAGDLQAQRWPRLAAQFHLHGSNPMSAVRKVRAAVYGMVQGRSGSISRNPTPVIEQASTKAIVAARCNVTGTRPVRKFSWKQKRKLFSRPARRRPGKGAGNFRTRGRRNPPRPAHSPFSILHAENRLSCSLPGSSKYILRPIHSPARLVVK
jgi:hypothetical protein